MLIGYLLIFGLIMFDQILKLLSLHFYTAGQSGTLIKVLINNVLEFHHLINTGASFGMLEGKQFLFSLITIGALIIFGYLFSEIDFKNKKVYSISVILFIAGTLGNAIDRIFRAGGVIDMIEMPILNKILGFINIPGFTFNLADVYLNFAIALFIIDIIFLEGKRAKKHETTEIKKSLS